jgi:hypothetical protein
MLSFDLRWLGIETALFPPASLWLSSIANHYEIVPLVS